MNPPGPLLNRFCTPRSSCLKAGDLPSMATAPPLAMLQVSGTQPAVRQMLDVQTLPPVQAPQSSVRPQPSPIVSQ